MNLKKCKLLRRLARAATIGCSERAYYRKLKGTITLDTDKREGGTRNTRGVYRHAKKEFKRYIKSQAGRVAA